VLDCSGLDNATSVCASTPNDVCPGELCDFGCWAGNNMLELFAALMDGHTVLDRPLEEPVADSMVPMRVSVPTLLGALGSSLIRHGRPPQPNPDHLNLPKPSVSNAPGMQIKWTRCIPRSPAMLPTTTTSV
jgi:hypothetical protein